MKKPFTSGLVILLPIALTAVIINFFINFVTAPFLELTQNFLEHLSFFHHPFFLFHQATLINFSSKVLILFILSCFVILIGIVGKLFLVDFLIRLGDYFLHRLPFVNKIYKACKDVVHSLFSSSSKKFSQVVLVPFPHPDSLCLGLVANEALHVERGEEEREHLISVFIPGTPNPSVGFLLMFKREQILFVSMKVEEAMKFIVSCGIVMPPFDIIQPHGTYEKQFFDQDYILSRERQLCKDSPDLHKSAGSF